MRRVSFRHVAFVVAAMSWSTVACGSDDDNSLRATLESAITTAPVDVDDTTSTVADSSASTLASPDTSPSPSVDSDGEQATASTDPGSGSTSAATSPATPAASTTSTSRPSIPSTVTPTAAPTSAPTPPVTSPPPSDPVGLRIEAEHPDGYNRDLFRHWVDADGDGCDTRKEVLIAESLEPVSTGSSCAILSGRWYSIYDNTETTDSSRFDIDHVVALKEAWDSGAWSWTADQRRDFANDLSEPFFLIAVSASSNRSKSDRDPAEWLPTNTSYRCEYVRIWVQVKRAWNLSVDQAEHDAIRNTLAAC